MKSILAFLLLAFSIGAMAQTTTVTATVQDSTGVTWINAPYSLTWAGEGHPSTTSGQSFTLKYTGTTDASGNLSISGVTDVAYIVPANSQWKMCVASATSAPTQWCVNIGITGASENISSQITGAIQPPSVTGGPLAVAYADSEVTATPGNMYFRLPDNTLRCYTNSWINCVPTIPVATAPTGACTAGLPNQQVISTGVQYSCQNVVNGVGTWAANYALPIPTTASSPLLIDFPRYVAPHTILYWNPTVGSAACVDNTATLNGAEVGDSIFLGLPILPAGVFAVSFVSAVNQVTVRVCNLSGGSVTMTTPFWGIYLRKVGGEAQ